MGDLTSLFLTAQRGTPAPACAESRLRCAVRCSASSRTKREGSCQPLQGEFYSHCSLATDASPDEASNKSSRRQVAVLAASQTKEKLDRGEERQMGESGVATPAGTRHQRSLTTSSSARLHSDSTTSPCLALPCARHATARPVSCCCCCSSCVARCSCAPPVTPERRGCESSGG